MRSPNSGSSRKSSRSDSYQKSYEQSKKKLLSAMVLMTQDQISEERSKSRSAGASRGADSFWTELETMLTRHESQMEKLAQQAIEVRSSLSAQRKIANDAHQRRMAEANAELEDLNKQIASYSAQIERNEADALAAKENELHDEIAETNSEIEQLTKKIALMRKSGKQLKERLEQARAEASAVADDLKERKRRSQKRAIEVNQEIKDTLKKINDLDEELSALETKEMACTALYARLKEDLPLAQRIFGKY